MSAIPLERGACIAEALPRPRGLAVGRAPAPLIGLLPVEVVPESVRPALEAYAVDLGEASSSRDHLKSAVDQVGHGWELAIASRAARSTIAALRMRPPLASATVPPRLPRKS